MSTLEDWLADAGQALSLPPGAVPADLRNELLDLTRDVAHGVARVAGPLTCYLVGLSVGRGAAPSTALNALTDLVRARAAESDPGGTVSAEPGTAESGSTSEHPAGPHIEESTP